MDNSFFCTFGKRRIPASILAVIVSILIFFTGAAPQSYAEAPETPDEGYEKHASGQIAGDEGAPNSPGQDANTKISVSANEANQGDTESEGIGVSPDVSQQHGYAGTGQETVLFPLASETDKIKATLSTDQTLITVKADDITLNHGISKVQFAVWGTSNGQNDLIWYTAEKAGNNYSLDIPVSKHRESGVCNIHVYATLSNGQNAFVGAAAVTVASISGTVSSPAKNDSAGNFTIKTEGLAPAAAFGGNVRVAVWSQANGQDDIRWYKMGASGSTYSADVNIANHKYDYGTYYAHVYAMQKNGIESFAGATTVTLTPPAASLSSSLNTDQTQISIAADGVVRPGVSKVQFAVWGSPNGQNDLRWYTASKNGNNHSFKVPVSGHRESGTYNIHIYATLVNGQSVFIGAKTVTVNPLSGTITSPAKNDSAGTFTIKAEGLAPAILSGNVRVAVWSQANGQDDIRWYKMGASGTAYSADVNISSHKYDYGAYHAHVYAVQKNGIDEFVGATTVTLTPPQSTTGPISSALNSDQTHLSILASSIVRSPGISSVQFAVWGNANGQNDIRWYTAKRDGNDYSFTAQVSSHRELGAYNVHVYATLVNGQRVFIGAAQATVAPLTASVSSPAKNDSAGTFSLGVSSLAPVSALGGNVRVAVWSANGGQDDIRWYTMPASEGVYSVNVNIASHKYDYGTYHAHVYAAQKNGIDGFVGATAVTLTPPAASLGASLSTDQMQISIWANGVVRPGLSNVRFAVWGNANGQNDIHWYTATKNGNNHSASIPVKNHKEPGTYSIHVYATLANGQSAFIGATSCTISDNPAGGTFVDTLDDVSIELTGVPNCPSGTQSVVFAIWSEENGQDDIEWLTGYHYAGSSAIHTPAFHYTSYIETYKHKWYSGKYNVHAYRYSNNGIFSFLAATSFYVKSQPKPGGANELVNAAKRYVGNGNMACDDLVDQAMADIGFPVMYGMYPIRIVDGSVSPWAYVDWQKYAVSVSDRKPGDILRSPGHVEVYIGNGLSVHGGYNPRHLTVVIASTTPGAQGYRI
ncbi:MAG: GBS Bsp-like repeat-containing protein [Clostridiales Family XIII bacterium]|nr:GBS Bsp-like repeat-containing protein [Clostridiales Family XIII bacterium]